MQFNYYLLSKSENRACSVSSLLFMACATPPFALLRFFFVCVLFVLVRFCFSHVSFWRLSLFVFVLSAYDYVVRVYVCVRCASVYVRGPR